MKKCALILLLTGLICLPQIGAAQQQNTAASETFPARVVEVMEQKTIANEAGDTAVQQKLKLRPLEGSWENKEIIYDGTQYEVTAVPEYSVGDKVQVTHTINVDGEDIFFVVDYVRQGPLLWLALLFAVIVIVVGRLKGLRALLVLVLTFLVILGFIIPRILDGWPPLLVSIIGAVAILVVAIYFTEGFKRSSTIAVSGILISLIITGLLSLWFTSLTKLTGFASDEAIYLISLGVGDLNVQGLLLAGIIIGALGVLDDVAISQTVLVREFKASNPDLSTGQVFKKAMRVGVSHMSSMVNTLFLAYAGAALPLLILFSINQPPFTTLGDVINNEQIATEIVRTLTGSIGLVLAVPITTWLAARFIRRPKPRPVGSPPHT